MPLAMMRKLLLQTSFLFLPFFALSSSNEASREVVGTSSPCNAGRNSCPVRREVVLWKGVLDLSPQGSVTTDNHLIIDNLQEVLKGNLTEEVFARSLSGFGMTSDSAGKFYVTNFMLCLWVWFKFFTKSSTLFSFANSDENSNTILLSVRHMGIFFSVIDNDMESNVLLQTGKWYHICMLRNLYNSKMILDGVVLAAEETSRATPIPLDGTLVIGQDQDSRGGHFNPSQALIGKLSNVHVWMSNEAIEFDEKYMCEKGYHPRHELLLQFDHLVWLTPLSRTLVFEDESTQHCDSNSQEMLIWTFKTSFIEGFEFCKLLGFTLPEITKEFQNKALTNAVSIISDYCVGTLSNNRMVWIANTIPFNENDEEIDSIEIKPVFNKTSHYDSANDTSFGNMVLLSNGKWRYADQNEKHCPICVGSIPNSTFYLRGLCKGAQDFIPFYPRIEKASPYFQSNINLVIVLQSNSWVLQQLGSEKYIIAELLGSNIPIGRHEWLVLPISIENCLYYSNEPDLEENKIRFTSDSAFNHLSEKRVLSLSQCPSSSLVCGDGSCVPMEERCSRSIKCHDGADELNCKTISVPESYDISLPPPGSSVQLELNLSLLKVSSVDIKKLHSKVQMNLTVIWKDNRLSFNNLQPNVLLNLVPDFSDIWVPQFQLRNEDRLAGTTEPLISLYLEKVGLSEFDGLNNVYKGGDVKIILKPEYSSTINCIFRFYRYPFDTQVCTMEIAITNIPKNHLQLNLTEVKLNDIQTKLPSEYYLSATELKLNSDGNIVYNFWMTRFAAYSLLSIYVPTMLMLLIGYGTLWIPVSDFQDRGTMSLTTLLVLISLYTDTLNNLPITSYVKFLDIWFVFNVSYISSIIFAHLFTSNTNLVMKFTQQSRFCLNNDQIMRIAQIFFTALFLFFQVVYWGTLLLVEF